MAKVKFITVKGSERLSHSPFYVGVVQHERIMSRREAYAYCAERTGYKPAAVRAVFLALAEYIRENQARGNITFIDGVASVRNYVKGAFETLAGPWVKGRNILMTHAVEMEPFKTVLAGIVPANNTEGAKPIINTVLDETTREYDVVTGTDLFSIAGADLAPDTSKEDEYVAIVSEQGVETKAAITFSDLQNVKAQFAAAPAPGAYTLKVYTRSGLGEAFGVKCATRRITIA